MSNLLTPDNPYTMFDMPDVSLSELSLEKRSIREEALLKHVSALQKIIDGYDKRCKHLEDEINKQLDNMFIREARREDYIDSWVSVCRDFNIQGDPGSLRAHLQRNKNCMAGCNDFT